MPNKLSAAFLKQPLETHVDYLGSLGYTPQFLRRLASHLNGKSTSKRKLAAARINAQRAGRPPLPASKLKPQSLYQRQRRQALKAEAAK